MLETLIDSMTEAVALLDADGQVLACNAALSRMSGYSADEWRGESLGLLFSRPGDRTPKREALERALSEGSVTGETAGVRRDGTALWLRYRVVRLTEAAASTKGLGASRRSGVPAFGSDPTAEHRAPNTEHPTPVLLAVAEDITANVELRFSQSLSRQLLEEASRREATLNHLNRELSALNQLSATVNQSLNLEAVLDTALERALEVIEATTGWVFLISHHNREELELVAHRGLPGEYVARHPRSQITECLPGKAVLTGKPLVLYSLPADEEMTPYLRQQEVRCVAHIPLRNRDRTIGVLGIGTDRMHQFSEGLIRFLTSVGHQVGLAIENARLYEQVKQRADLDPLTGLYNRQRFCELLDARTAVGRSAYGVGADKHAPPRVDPDAQGPGPNDDAPWVLMIDIDNFKQINDSHGHDRGDQVLRELAAFLRQSVREGDIAGRYGGDEFVVALCGDEDGSAEARAKRAEAVVDRLRARFDEAGRSGRFSAPLAVSIGSARSGPSIEDCLKLADEAMYREKRRRKRSAARSKAEDKRMAATETAVGSWHERHSSTDSCGEPISALRAPQVRPPAPEDHTSSSG